jgi:hypothetical protein
MFKIKKAMSLILAALMLLSVFAAAQLSAGAAVSDKAKTGGMFKTIGFSGEESIEILDWQGYHEGLLNGVSYDSDTNTLTLDNVDFAGEHSMYTYFMGDDFKVNIIGTCTLDMITVYDGCLGFVGSGELTVGSENADYAVQFKALADDYYNFSMDVAPTATLTLMSSKDAFRMQNSTHSDPNTVFTIGGTEAVDVCYDEHEKYLTKKVKGGEISNWTYDSLYLAERASDPDHTYCVSEKKYNGDDEPTYDFRKCYFNDDLDCYLVDNSEYVGEYSKEELKDTEFTVTATSIADNAKPIYVSTKEVYENKDGDEFAVEFGDVYNFSDDNTIEFKGEKIYVFETNNEVDSDNLSEVQEEDPFIYYDYYYGDKTFENKGTPDDNTTETTEPNTEDGTQPDTTTETEPSTDEPDGGNNLPASEYNLWVAGVPVTASNADNITGSGITGHISYDAATKTLTFDNATVSDYYAVLELDNSYQMIAGVYSTDDLNVVFNGDNTVKLENNASEAERYAFYGFAVYGKRLTVESGTLNTDGIICGRLTINEAACVDSSYDVDATTASHSVNTTVLEVNGTLKATTDAEIREYPTIEARDITVGKNGVIEVDKSVNTGIFIAINGWSPSPAAAIELSGTMLNNGKVTLKSDCMAPASSSSGKAVKIGYGIYSDEENAEVVMGEWGSLVAEGNRSAFGGGLTMSLTGNEFEILGGESADTATAKGLDETGEDKYISIKSIKEPVSEPETTTSAQDDTQSTGQGDTPTEYSEPDSHTDYNEPDTPTEPGETIEPTKEGEVTPTEAVEPTKESETVEPTKEGGVTPTEAVEPTKEGGTSVEPTDAGKDKNNDKPTVKAANPLKALASSSSIKAAALQKSSKTVKPFTISGAKGSVAVTKVKSGTTASIYNKISVNRSTGAITLKKGEYKKGTYKVKLNITAGGDSFYDTKTVSITAVIKISGKMTNTVKVKTFDKGTKTSVLKKSKKAFKLIKISKAKGNVKVTKVKKGTTPSIYKKITVNKKTGKITFKKGSYKAGTYKIKLKIKVKGNADYSAKTVKKTVKLYIKAPVKKAAKKTTSATSTSTSTATHTHTSSSSGHRTCTSCGGSGRRTCFSCGGLGGFNETIITSMGSNIGGIYIPPRTTTYRRPCSACNGSGRVICTSCGGSGFIN